MMQHTLADGGGGNFLSSILGGNGAASFRSISNCRLTSLTSKLVCLKSHKPPRRPPSPIIQKWFPRVRPAATKSASLLAKAA
jgi:hypothetical protein